MADTVGAIYVKVLADTSGLKRDITKDGKKNGARWGREWRKEAAKEVNKQQFTKALDKELGESAKTTARKMYDAIKSGTSGHKVKIGIDNDTLDYFEKVARDLGVNFGEEIADGMFDPKVYASRVMEAYEAIEKEVQKSEQRITKNQEKEAEKRKKILGEFEDWWEKSYEANLKADRDRWQKWGDSATKHIGRVRGESDKLGKSGKGFGALSKRMRLILGAIVALAEPAAVALKGLAGAATAVAGSMYMAVGAAGALVPLLVGLAGTGGAVLIGMQGMGNAFSAINAEWKKSVETGKAFNKNSKEVQKALKGLSPEARKTALAFADMKKPLDDMKKAVQEKLFEGMDAALKKVSGELPKVTKGFEALATSANKFAQNYIDMLIGADLGSLMKGLAPAMDKTFAAFTGFSSGFLTFVQAATPAADRMAASLQKSAESFKAMMEAGKESGSINQFLQDAQDHMSAWWTLIRSTGSALNTLFKSGADEGLTLLSMLTGVVDKWNEWMQSVQGQASLDQFFANSIAIMQAFVPILTGIRDMFSNLITEDSIARFAELSESIGTVLPVLGSLFSLLGQTGIINAAASLLAMLATAIEPMIPVLSVIAGLIESTFARLLTAIQPVIDILSTTLIGVFEAIAPSLDTFLVAFADGFAMVMEAVGPLIAALGPLLEAILPALFEALTPIITVVAQVASAIATALVPIIEALTPLMNTLIPLLVSLFVAFNPVLRVVMVLGPVLAAVAEPLAKLIAGIINFIAPALEFVFIVGEWIVKFLTVGKVIGTVVGWFGKIGSAIGEAAGVVGTKIGDMVTKFKAFGDRVKDIVMAIPNFFRNAMDKALGIVRGITDKMKGLFNNTLGRIPGVPKFAAGGITMGPSLVGEAGPEMVIPLTRPLSQVDPSVRAIAAMLRGQGTDQVVTGGSTGPTKIVNNDIKVYAPSADPEAVAAQVVNRSVAMAQ